MKNPKGFFVAGALVSLSLAASAPARADEVYMAVAGDATLAPAPGGHGIALVDWRKGFGSTGAYLDFTYNTDTVDVAFDQIALGNGVRLRLGAFGEVREAGVLSDYWVEGEELSDRGISASRGGAYAEVKRAIGRSMYVNWRTTAQRWFFSKLMSTGDSVLLPLDFTSIDEHLSLTLWHFSHDRSQWQPHRLFGRFVGIGAGVAADYQWRSLASRWGAIADPRNIPSAGEASGSEWIAGGTKIVDRLRWQFRQEGRFGVGEDDITRGRIGGMNPYSVRLAGSAWPAFLSSRYLAGHASLRYRAFGESEIGILGDAVWLRDPRRNGSHDFGAIGGIGALLDARWGPWQADLRAGWTLPSQWMATEPHVNVFFAVGREIH